MKRRYIQLDTLVAGITHTVIVDIEAMSYFDRDAGQFFFRGELSYLQVAPHDYGLVEKALRDEFDLHPEAIRRIIASLHNQKAYIQSCIDYAEGAKSVPNGKSLNQLHIDHDQITLDIEALEALLKRR
jgi:hypothetical protein